MVKTGVKVVMEDRAASFLTVEALSLFEGSRSVHIDILRYEVVWLRVLQIHVQRILKLYFVSGVHGLTQVFISPILLRL